MNVDWHAFLPEAIVAGTVILLLLVDLILPNRSKWTLGGITALGLLAAAVPIATLAADFADGGENRVFFADGYVVDELSLVLKGFFLASGYVALLLAYNTIEEGAYYRGEFYFLLVSAVLGMMMIASVRDLIGLFIAFELFSAPGYLLAAWKKYDLKSNESGMKYFLMGVTATAIMLYGMSLLYGATGTLTYSGLMEVLPGVLDGDTSSLAILGIVLVIASFAFKVSAVPFHFWAPDTYEGAPTPVAAFFSVAVKGAGFMGLVSLIFFALPAGDDVWRPMIWVIAALTMTIGNLIALRQENIVRLLAYSSIAQSGYILAPLTVAALPDGEGFGPGHTESLQAVVIYLLVYAVMNFGAFGVVIAVARRTHSGHLDSYDGLFAHAPSLAVVMTMFLAALAGIPPLAGWLGKLAVFTALISADEVWGYLLAVIVAVNAVIAAFYYMRVVRKMFAEEAPEEYLVLPPLQPTPSLQFTLGGLTLLVLAAGVTPMFSHLSEIATNSLSL